MIKITDSNSMQVNTFSHNIVFGFTKSIIRHYYLNNIFFFLSGFILVLHNYALL